MIKTDKVIYRTRTQEEYDWLMKKLETDGYRWDDGNLPTEINNWRWYFNETCIDFKDKIITSADFDLYGSDAAYKDYECIEVSDLMGNEGGTDYREGLKAINEQVTSQIEDLRKRDKEPKAIEYTIKVYYE